MIKMLLFDLDDTLLNSEKIISDRTYKAVVRAYDSGIKIGYVTARSRWSGRRIIDGLPADAVAYCSGAQVYCNDKLVFESYIPGKKAVNLLDGFKKEYPERRYFTIFEPYSYISGGDLWKDGTPCDEQENDIRDKYGYQRIVFLDTYEADICSMADADVDCIKSRYGGLVVTAPNVNKGHAVNVIASCFGFENSDIVAFGDDTSDFPMLRASGTGVAMENAVYEVKSVADYITDSHDEDGVGKWIEKHILNEV
jgi:Cof subfamily protein (haloacid dehalogenase superfamily)